MDDTKEISFMCTLIRSVFLACGIAVVVASISLVSLLPSIWALVAGQLVMLLLALLGYALSSIVTSLHSISQGGAFNNNKPN
jgi:urea transporter